jgi:hypothetical protein
MYLIRTSKGETEHMAEPIDKAQLGPTQQVELYEGGKILIIDDATDPFLQGVITLEAKAATLLFHFLLAHQDQNALRELTEQVALLRETTDTAIKHLAGHVSHLAQQFSIDHHHTESEG